MSSPKLAVAQVHGPVPNRIEAMLTGDCPMTRAAAATKNRGFHRAATRVCSLVLLLSAALASSLARGDVGPRDGYVGADVDPGNALSDLTVVCEEGRQVVLLKKEAPPKEPRRLGYLELPGAVSCLAGPADFAPSTSWVRSGAIVFLTLRPAGIALLDIHNAAAPYLVRILDETLPVLSLAMDGQILRIKDGMGIERRYDVSAPNHPRELAVPSPAVPGLPAQQVQLDDSDRSGLTSPGQMRLQSRKKLGRSLLIAGAAGFAGAYLLPAVIGGAVTGDYRYALPVAGPMWMGGLTLSALSGCSSSDLGCYVAGPVVGLIGVVLILDGFLQAAGLGLLTAGGVVLGTADKTKTTMTVRPSALRSSSGLEFSLAF